MLKENQNNLGVVLDEKLIHSILSRAATTLGIKVDRAELDAESVSGVFSSDDLIDTIIGAGAQVGLAVSPSKLRDTDQIVELVRDGLPVILLPPTGTCYLLRQCLGRRVEANRFEEKQVAMVTLTHREIGRFLADDDIEVLVVKSQLDCDSISTNPSSDQSHHHGEHLPPLKRFWGLLRMDRRDIWTIIVFSLVSAILGLAAPLAVESLVNVVSWGIYIQPLLVLAGILLVFLALSAALNVLQSVVVEIIQRRQFVRFVCDLSHRFPRANQQQLEGIYPRELANRLFDIMTIQKATAMLLIEGISVVLLSALGLVLLGFYHPFLLGFDLVLVVMMTIVTVMLGRGGINTSIEESRKKYATMHWLQDIIDSPTAFRINGGESLGIERASKLASDYVGARKNHFSILLRQIVFAEGLRAMALTILLGLGGFLVIQGELTLGQLVASELVVATVVGAFAKAGKSIESFYDLMAGVDKVGHLVDLATDPIEPINVSRDAALAVSWQRLDIQHGNQALVLEPYSIPAGRLLGIVTRRHVSLLSRVLTGLVVPRSGMVEVDGICVSRLTMGGQLGRLVGFASQPEIFHGSVADNIDLGRSCVGRARVREVLQQLGMWSEISRMKDGLNSFVQTNGYPLSPLQQKKLMIARAVAARPRVLIVEGLLDTMPRRDQDYMLEFFRQHSHECTTIVLTGLDPIAQQCEERLLMEA
jgi:putative ABC transport system ATP-binding protein